MLNAYEYWLQGAHEEVTSNQDEEFYHKLRVDLLIDLRESLEDIAHDTTYGKTIKDHDRS